MELKADDILKMSVLNAVLTLKEYRNLYPNKTINELIAIINAVGTYHSNYDYCTSKKLLEVIELQKITDIKCLITAILKETFPGWLYQVPFGREIVATCLRDNEKTDVLQCLESAGLYSKHPDNDVVEWWDELASLVRLSEDELKLRSGRGAERLTLEHERGKLIDLMLEPYWISLENNFAGYDVLSYEEGQTGIRPKMIEVKSCKSRPIVFYLSKNEWKTAQKIGDGYVFHIWYLAEKRLLELRVEDVGRSIPINQGLGDWQTVLINVDSAM
ncbi:protein NO VEIN domain-containing protein [Paenibacillus lautus]|uniref:protein NO VEIN domain-containing protein n=1 Tax=Paenibacillus lautus TaxID=1401 RepID=UPI0013E340AC|nr:DUF3883 domain-containing protein [Paenibacillus lautus]